MLVKRDTTRTEHDDWVLNVQSLMGEHDGSVALRDEDGNIVAWKIDPAYE